ncbi:MAG: translocation/assembly module TamB domain-containing protein [Rhodobacteraceae bacterium]|nr:translocation/assembly module TamB domain-containing protein [Paracoccaceae bacterium]
MLGLTLGTTLLACLVFAAGQAQETTAEENGFLVRKLEENLSAEGRTVRFRDVSGILSSDATIGEITIADETGVWLRIENAGIIWTRTALLRGVVSVNSLSADRIAILRKPVAANAGLEPNSRSWTIPDLPVSVNIDKITIKRLEIDPSLTGIDAVLAANAALGIDSTGMRASLDASRLGRSDDRLHLDIDLVRETRTLNLDVVLDEAADGLIANALHIQDHPPVRAAITGKGTLDEIEITASVSTDQPDLVTGRFSVKPSPEGHDMTALIEGQFGQLVPAIYADFFTGTSRLQASALLKTDGGLEISDFQTQLQGFNLSGNASTTRDFFLSRLELQARTGVAPKGGLVLPFGNGAYRLQTAGLDIAYGTADATGWRGIFWAEGLQTPDISLERVRGGGQGTISDITNPDSRALTGRLTASLSGAKPLRPGWAVMLEDGITANLVWDWSAGNPLKILTLKILGKTDQLEASGQMVGTGFDGKASIQLADLRRIGPLFDGFSPTGAADIGYAGKLDFLTGGFDGNLLATTRDLGTGIDRLDPFLKGEARLGAKIRRDETGLSLGEVELRAASVSAVFDAFLGPDQHRLDLKAEFADLSIIAPDLGGKGQLAANFQGSFRSSDGKATLESDSGIAVSLTGRVGDQFDLAFSVTELPLELVNEIAPDLGLQGRVDGSGKIIGPRNNPLINFDAVAKGVTATALTDLKLGRLDGKAAGSWQNGLLQLDTISASDGGGLSASGKGALDTNQRHIDMQVDGSAPLGLANRFLAGSNMLVSGEARFDLAIAGSFELPQITGSGRIANALVALPDYNVNLGGLAADLVFEGQSVRIVSANADVRGGGQVTAKGSVGLSGGLPVDLTVDLRAMRYSDGAMISTVLNGQLALTGGLGSAVTISGLVTPDGIDIALNPATVEGRSLIEIRHISPPPSVRRTLERAGLGPESKLNRGGGIGMRLALRVDAPNRIFIRGRGVDAEMGGAIDVSGDITDVSVAGSFSLLRGRINFLDRRLDLRDGSLSFSGSLDPVINFSADTSVNGTEVTLSLSGLASAPELSLRSSPDMPQDEILAQLIFGRDMSSLSPFQILRLASAVAELAGGGDTGLVDGLRRAAGVDNLDVRTSDNGATTGTVGKYLQDNIYSEIEATTDGKAKVSINMDLTPNLSVRGSVDNDGSGGVGIYFERDY